ncbi:putative transcription factor & chromatin remodeling ARID family [Helianthus anomalus]
MAGMENIRIQSVFYTPDIDRSVLSLDQLITQGYTVKFTGDKCKLFPTFGAPLFNKRSDKTGLAKEEEVGMLEKESVLSRENDHERFKNEFLNGYFESFVVSTNEPDWNVLILQAMSFKEFNDCKALLDMLEDEDYMLKYRYHLDIKFNEMIDWFLKVKLEIFTRPLPVYASENRKVCLLDLYMGVKREGGHRYVTENNLWAKVAKEIGFDYNEGEYMRLLYAMYLDVIIYYYKYKSVQEDAKQKEEIKMVTDPRQVKSDEDKMEGTEILKTTGNTRTKEVAENDADHYALFAGNDWEGIRRLNTRRRFDFKRAKAAVDDANISVVTHSRKRNYV